jgi:hypothetical protein
VNSALEEFLAPSDLGGIFTPCLTLRKKLREDGTLNTALEAFLAVTKLDASYAVVAKFSLTVRTFAIVGIEFARLSDARTGH